MSEGAEVIARVEGQVGRLTLNRPRALNALTQGMCQAMTDALLAWLNDPLVAIVLIDHAGERGFCAGGDIRLVAESGAGDGAAARGFFFTEYRLNELLHRYPKPTIAVMDGITMGGGVGLSLPCRIRVATERTVLAMPETGIGLFPDVGAGWHLPRLPGQTGLWLALTGARLKAADCLGLGLATHAIAGSDAEAVKAQIVAGAEPEAVLQRHRLDPGSAPILEHRADIDRLFDQPSVEAVFAALGADGSAWAAAQLDTLRTKSPQALKLTFRQLREGRRRSSFVDEMKAEFRLAVRVVRRHDFQEGVRAVIIDKDNAPRWDPPDLAGVADALLDELFAPLAAGEDWTPLP